MLSRCGRNAVGVLDVWTEWKSDEGRGRHATENKHTKERGKNREKRRDRGEQGTESTHAGLRVVFEYWGIRPGLSTNTLCVTVRVDEVRTTTTVKSRKSIRYNEQYEVRKQDGTLRNGIRRKFGPKSTLNEHTGLEKQLENVRARTI